MKDLTMLSRSEITQFTRRPWPPRSRSTLPVYPDGRVGLVLQNAACGTTQRVPKLGEFRTALATPGTSAEDVYVLVNSPNRLKLERFSNLSGRMTLISGEDKYQLHELLELAGSDRVAHATAIVVITVPVE